MRKFEELTLQEQKRIQNFIIESIRSYTNEKYHRKSKAELHNVYLDIKPDMDEEGEIDYCKTTIYFCNQCNAYVGRKDLIEHIMIHLGIE